MLLYELTQTAQNGFLLHADVFNFYLNLLHLKFAVCDYSELCQFRILSHAPIPGLTRTGAEGLLGCTEGS